ncbi:MAG TPA: hypothetical protein VGE39_16115 [Prosthecobacter sp.]
MTPEHEELIYEGIRRMVIWDEPRDEVFHRLEVNGITGERAEAIYAKARAARIQEIRSDCVRRAVKGLLFLVVGAGVALEFLTRGAMPPRVALAPCMAAVGYGLWQSFKGVFGYVLAPSKKGSLADDE